MASIEIDDGGNQENNKLSDLEDSDASISSITSSSSNECPFNTDIASKLIGAFSKATKVDADLAGQLLRDHGWNIDDALKAAYEVKEHTQSTINTKTKFNENCLKIISWNTDTTDSDDIESVDLIQQRTENIIEILLEENPDIILLQQVGTYALTLIITCLSTLYNDESIQIDSPTNCNYISIFTRKSLIKKKNISVINHLNNWNMLKIEVEYKNSICIDVYNAYVDDETLPFFFEQIHQNDSNHHVLCGISKKNSNDDGDNWNYYTMDFKDLWEVTGKQCEINYTYNPEMNSNINGNDRAERSDRIYFRSSNKNEEQLKPVHMEFEGTKQIKTLEAIYPSTHWAIQGYFNVEN